MERKFYTLVKENHKFGGNDYIRGKIHSYKELICDGERDGLTKPAFAWNIISGVGHAIATECTQEQYDHFSQMVEKHYPGLCEFDCKKE